MSEFDDIRPYNDSEVPAVIARLIADSEFIDLLLSRKHHYWPKSAPGCCAPCCAEPCQKRQKILTVSMTCRAISRSR